MKEINKKIAAIAMAGFLMGTTSGCGNGNSVDPIEYVVNVQNTNRTSGSLDGSVTLNQLEDYYIIKIRDFENQERFYLTYKVTYCPLRAVAYDNYIISGSDIVVATNKHNSEKFDCKYGEVLNAVEFIQYIQKYSTIKEKYKFNEIEDIYNKIVEENKNENVKKYTLK